MKNSEIKALSTEELQEKIASAEKNYQSLKFAHAVSPVENPMQIRERRRFVASLKTEMHSRTSKQVSDKIESGELNRENAREFLENQKLPSSFTLAKINKLLNQAGK